MHLVAPARLLPLPGTSSLVFAQATPRDLLPWFCPGADETSPSIPRHSIRAEAIAGARGPLVALEVRTTGK